MSHSWKASLLIRAYAVIENELNVADVVSQNELNDLSSRVEWVWVDCCDLDDAETMIMSKLLGVETTTVDGIEDGKVRPRYEKCLDESCPVYTWISTPLVEYVAELKMHPLSIILKDKFLITLHNGQSSRVIESTFQTFKESLAEGKKFKSGFIAAKLLHEIVDENSRAMVAIRDQLDKIEEEAMEKPWEKTITQSIFKLKRGLSSLHRLLLVEEELLSDMEEGIIPRIKLASEVKIIVDDAMDDIKRELEFVDSYNRSLDSALRLQESARALRMIHRTERAVALLTAILIILTVVLILLEIQIF